jgi:hypothetical protein
MGIKPTGKALPELENTRFCTTANPKCDLRVNFRGMWGNVRLRRDTSVSEPRCDRRVVANAFGIQEYASTRKEPVTWMKLANQETELR